MASVSPFRCKKCNQQHSYLLHNNAAENQRNDAQNQNMHTQANYNSRREQNYERQQGNQQQAEHQQERTSQNLKLDALLKSFWEIEKVQDSQLLSAEQKRCEDHFKNTVQRTKAGEFIVKYPFKTPKVQLGESLNIAINRFKQVERRLHKNKHYVVEYKKFMDDYINLGHMIEVPPPNKDSEFRCYLPHHFVLKESSTTTKFRVVFDASAKTSNGLSLNDTMMVGPTVQDKLANLIMRFRKHKIAINADIEKMYRQILVSSDDQEFQHIVWRESPDQPLKHYKLLTITYGTAAGPYLATRVLSELAKQVDFPIASPVLQEDFYMDDLLSGADTEENAVKLQHEIIELLKRCGMSIRKFTSNSEKALMSIPEDLGETKSLTFDKDATVKTLGIYWNPAQDCFGFRADIFGNVKVGSLTKRVILSEISKLFDPIENLNWDDLVPITIQQKWDNFKIELKNLQMLKIPRAQVGHSGKNRQTYLVGFSDASEQAYSAVVYLVYYDEKGNGLSYLVSSKTRVAPVRQQSLPRLELCGALLLAEFMPLVAKALKMNFTDMVAYADSTLTLGWIRSEPYKYKTFVANRITKIQELIPGDKWGFVRGIDNPADCASRGISVQEFINHPLWWNGPSWLNEKPPVPNKYSTLTRLQRITARLLRFINNTRAAVQKKHGFAAESISNPWLSTVELEVSLRRWICIAQEEEFASDLLQLRTKGKLSSKSSLLSLNPFIDKDNILRVGGRLRHASIPVHQKHPILLPPHHRITTMIIENAHLLNLHAGSQTLLSYLQQRYWIVRGKDAVRRIIRKCVICTRNRAETMQQMMADLPSFRVTPSHTFQKCGIDYAGPFLIRPITPRSKVTLKAYLAIFICCATRAIHLEVVSSASTEAFIAALRRFIARRGKPSDIYSDNGTNFVGADKELKELQKLTDNVSHNNQIALTMSKEGISWHFNPPSAPHFGGLWEAGVKSTKYHLRRIMGLNRLTFEELTTLTSQIEAVLNSRPLTPESTDPSDLRALTPGHFIIGQPLTSIPDPDLTEIPTTRLVRWQLVQQMLQQFWKRWSSEYIVRLQQRPKWMQPVESIKEGSLVIIKEDNLPPLHWKLGRVIEVKPGADQKVRKVLVRAATGEYERPIVKLCLLPVETENADLKTEN
ncbi:uncharacterized protein LOC110859615 [Folsomia candida]|uniref:uncharacterized protein LOC110859615 n=1 Tax=Folsomia candida TaxID=158441 RepID=UPI000B8FFC8A|nr:uncharacterized protein LOC110859615 [Folsomia candida]